MSDPCDATDPRLSRAAEVIRLEARTIANLEPQISYVVFATIDALQRTIEWIGTLGGAW